MLPWALLLLLVPLWSLVPGFRCLWCPGLEHLHGGPLLPCPRSLITAPLLLALCEGGVAPGVVRGASAVQCCKVHGVCHRGACRQGRDLGTSAAKELGPRLPATASWLLGAADALPPGGWSHVRLSCCSQALWAQPPWPEARMAGTPCTVSLLPLLRVLQATPPLQSHVWNSLVCWAEASFNRCSLVVGERDGQKGTFQTAVLLTPLCHALPFPSMALPILSSAHKWNCTILSLCDLLD